MADYIKIQLPKGSAAAERIETLLAYGGYKNANQLAAVAINRLYEAFLEEEAGKPFPEKSTEHLALVATSAQVATLSINEEDDEGDIGDKKRQGQAGKPIVAARQSGK